MQSFYKARKQHLRAFFEVAYYKCVAIQTLDFDIYPPLVT